MWKSVDLTFKKMFRPLEEKRLKKKKKKVKTLMETPSVNSGFHAYI